MQNLQQNPERKRAERLALAHQILRLDEVDLAIASAREILRGKVHGDEAAKPLSV